MVGDFPVISETFVINIAAGLVEHGHDPRLLAMSGQARAPVSMHRDVARLDLAHRVHRPRLGRALIAPFARSDGDGIHRWGLPRRAAAFAAQAGMLAPLPRFDIVHCQFATLGLQAMRHIDLGVLRTRRLVVHVRGQDVTVYPRVHGEDAFRRCFARADLLVANCEHFRQRAIALGARPEKVIVIGSGIQTDLFHPRTAPRRPGPLRLIAVGRLVEKKGFEDAIAAMARLPHAQGPHAQGSDSLAGATLDIVGGGPLHDSLARLAAELGLSERIRLLGPMPHEAIVERLNDTDIMLAPSVTARSGDQDAPVNTLKEAMAMELPVIATRHGGIPELVEDGQTGYLVPERDPDALAAAIAKLHGERARWADMGRRGRRRVVETYDQRVVTDRLHGAYRAILEDGDQTK